MAPKDVRVLIPPAFEDFYLTWQRGLCRHTSDKVLEMGIIRDHLGELSAITRGKKRCDGSRGWNSGREKDSTVIVGIEDGARAKESRSL